MSITSQDNSKRTRPHRRVETILEGMRINFESECADFAPYSLDIYFPEWHCAVEVDGPTHSKAKDKKRDGVLMERFQIPVLHLRSDATQQFIEDEIGWFVNEQAKSALARKRVWRMGLNA